MSDGKFRVADSCNSSAYSVRVDYVSHVTCNGCYHYDHEACDGVIACSYEQRQDQDSVCGHLFPCSVNCTHEGEYDHEDDDKCAAFELS